MFGHVNYFTGTFAIPLFIGIFVLSDFLGLSGINISNDYKSGLNRFI